MAGNIKIGTYTGTGAAQNIICGWVPEFFMTFNITDGTPAGIWFNGMTAGTALDLAAAIASNADNGFTALESESLGRGITVGTDYSTNAKVYRYVAMRGDQ